MLWKSDHLYSLLRSELGSFFSFSFFSPPLSRFFSSLFPPSPLFWQHIVCRGKIAMFHGRSAREGTYVRFGSVPTIEMYAPVLYD